MKFNFQLNQNFFSSTIQFTPKKIFFVVMWSRKVITNFLISQRCSMHIRSLRKIVFLFRRFEKFIYFHFYCVFQEETKSELKHIHTTCKCNSNDKQTNFRKCMKTQKKRNWKWRAKPFFGLLKSSQISLLKK